MSYRIEIEPEAEAGIDEAYHWLFERSPESAERWRQQLAEKLQSLAENPERCPLAHEERSIERGIREILFGRRRGIYRILFDIRGDTVRILHVRHGARRSLDE